MGTEVITAFKNLIVEMNKISHNILIFICILFVLNILMEYLVTKTIINYSTIKCEKTNN